MSGLVNRALVFLARSFGLSPGVVHVLLLLLVTIGYGAKEYRPFSSFREPLFVGVWFGLCAAVVLITWQTKGEYRRIWWKAAPWKQDSSA
jgi:hypothetical protein